MLFVDGLLCMLRARLYQQAQHGSGGKQMYLAEDTHTPDGQRHAQTRAHGPQGA